MDHRRAIQGFSALFLLGAMALAVHVVTPLSTPQISPAAPLRQDPPAPPVSQEDPFKPNPRFSVKPIESEPAWPDPADTEALKKLGGVPVAGGYQFDMKDPAGKRRAGVVLSAVVIMDRGMIEVFTCEAGGKEHESILRIEADLQALDMGLILSGLKRGILPKKLGVPDPAQGSRVAVLVQWNQDGRVLTYRAEDLIIHLKRGTPMPRIGWTYVGQWIEIPDQASGGRKTHRVLAATGTRSVITTFHDSTSLLDNPLEEGDDDTLFAANFMILPPPGTKVRLMFRAPTDEESARISALEKELTR